MACGWGMGATTGQALLKQKVLATLENPMEWGMAFLGCFE